MLQIHNEAAILSQLSLSFGVYTPTGNPHFLSYVAFLRDLKILVEEGLSTVKDGVELCVQRVACSYGGR